MNFRSFSSSGPRAQGWWVCWNSQVWDRVIGRPGYLGTAMVEGGPGLVWLAVEERRELAGGVEEGRVLAGGVEGVVPLAHYQGG